MKKYLKIGLFGVLTWLIPFVASFFFFSREGKVLIDIFLFKTIMVVLGSVVGAFFLILYFKKIKKNYLKEGIVVGLIWFILNILLDLIVLIPMSGMNVGDYFAQIGLRYLIIPVMSIAVGYVAESR